MKRILCVIILLPQLALAQFYTDCFTLTRDRGITEISIDNTFKNDTIVPIKITEPISGLSISGTAMLENDIDSYVRVVLKDKFNYEYLIYEYFPLLEDKSGSSFSNTGIETLILNGVIPQEIRVELHNSSLRVASIQYLPSSESEESVTGNSAIIQKTQCQYIANKLNENLQKNNMTWRAGITSISMKTYEEKKTIFGGKVPFLYGYDYYKGGIFVIPDPDNVASKRVSQRSMVTNTFVKEWDWRSRHGKNWMTPVRDQHNCHSCWAFASIGVLEAYINIYYNHKYDMNLSENELLYCPLKSYWLPRGCNGSAWPVDVYNYIKSNGIVNEECFSYSTDSLPCASKCSNPSELIFIENDSLYNVNESTMKSLLFKSPVTLSLHKWNHSVVLAGYKEIEAGDIVWLGDSVYNSSGPITISENYHQSLIDRTVWLIKDSYGTNWGDNGYGYILVAPSNINSGRAIYGSITSLNLSDSDIECTDADGDGYYFWGLGPKPSHCPSWAPDEPDGDDSNSNYGPLDAYGNLQVLTPSTVTINTVVTYNGSSALPSHIEIVGNGTLILTGLSTMGDNDTITIFANGTLIIDGGTLQNAHLDLRPGCHLIIRHNGSTNMPIGSAFEAPQGVLVDVEYGSIN